MTTEPKFPPDILFCPARLTLSMKCYLVDENTIKDILKAMDCKTASQAYIRAKLFEVIEQNTSEDRCAEK